MWKSSLRKREWDGGRLAKRPRVEGNRGEGDNGGSDADVSGASPQPRGRRLLKKSRQRPRHSKGRQRPAGRGHDGGGRLDGEGRFGQHASES